MLDKARYRTACLWVDNLLWKMLIGRDPYLSKFQTHAFQSSRSFIYTLHHERQDPYLAVELSIF